MRKILFGGAFDPIHNGHINMAELASKQLDADVIFLPTKSAVWKEASTEVKHKIKMVELSIKDNSRFSVDLFEVNNNKETTYTIETVRYFVNKYSEDEFYYLIGADQVNKFHLWKEAEEIAKLVHIIYLPRPDINLDSGNIAKFHMTEIVGTLLDVSSTDIRDLKSLQVSKEVIDYIVNNNLYFVPKIRDFLAEKRFNHSVSVANLAYEIAKKHNLDRPDRYFIAGILHDIGKEIDQKPIMVEHYQEYLDLPKFSYHQFAGEYITKNEFGIKDKDILEAIKYHATGYEALGTMAKIVYAADKIEPTRGFDSSDLIKAMMEDIDLGFKTVLQANKDFLLLNRKDINNRLTSKCFDYYLK